MGKGADGGGVDGAGDGQQPRAITSSSSTTFDTQRCSQLTNDGDAAQTDDRRSPSKPYVAVVVIKMALRATFGTEVGKPLIAKTGFKMRVMCHSR